MKELVEEILLAHILTGEIEVDTNYSFTSNFEFVYHFVYRESILFKMYENKTTSNYRIISFVSDVSLDGISDYNNIKDVLHFVEKINQFLNTI